ncbi:MAG: hypothetical protein PHY43_03525 [Verrucomicrobiales bacterium]|nr:hypothetical protein [Verrucomicrobiales bacterium]
MKRLMKWPVICGLSGLLLAQTVPAGQEYYINNDVVSSAPNIDATNFINNSYFSSGTVFPYETTSTRNYTNNDTMIGLGGFRFDTFSGSTRSMAVSFYNPGSIACLSGGQFGQIIVNATNIASPGVMDVGLNGGILLTGQNVDLTYSTLTISQGGGNNSSFGIIGTAGNFGLNTNQNWNPGAMLTANSATSSDPNVFTLINSKSYFKTDAITPSNKIVRAVFIRNPYPTVTNKVYFPVNSNVVNVEWIGTYVNPATGQTLTNYLYLANDYLLGATTNVTLVNGIPDNFQFTKSTVPLPLTGLAAPSFQPLLPSASITNPYSYTLAEFVPTSVATGPTASNPSGALTNLPARTQISASRQLNLALATISGQNYLSLTCTNQFDGSDGATIVSPFSDINLGVTNGSIVVSNLLQSVIPNWVGSVQAWSTRWLYTDTNAVPSVDYDFRVLLVDSQVFPFTSPQVQDLTLHSTNVIISDVFNISRNLSIDARSLTLTANVGYPATGAGSPEGELNLENNNVFFASSLPNLLWLTNNGKITMGNAGNFGGPPPANYQTFINNGLLSDQGSAVYASYFKNSGTILNGLGNFSLQSLTAVLTGGSITAIGDISITADSLVASNVVLTMGRSLTLRATNLLTDLNSSNNWTVGGSSLVALNLPIKPAAGDLLGTSISEVASTNKNVVNTWAGEDRGVSTSGYVDNVAVGRLVLNALSVPPHSVLTFNGAGATNAMYVDVLVLTNFAATLNFTTSNATALAISPGMVIYYQQAFANGVDVTTNINGWNNNRLRWVNLANLAQASITLLEPSDPPESFHFKVSGVQFPSGLATGSNYKVIIQATTNLISPNWVNVYTGAPPFTFNDFGFTTNKQQFYRAKQGW